MTLEGVVIRPLTWTPDGGDPFDCQRADLGLVLQIVTGLDEVPSVRGEDVTIPGRPGVIPGNREADRRSLELAGWIAGATAEDQTELERRASYREMVSALQAAFAPTLTGTLEVVAEDGATYSIAARPLTIVYGTEDVPAFRYVSVALISTTDPEWTVTPAPS